MSNIKDVCFKLATVSNGVLPSRWPLILSPWYGYVYWSHWHTWRGRRTYVRMFMTSWVIIDGLPYFLNYGAPRASAFGARGTPLRGISSKFAKSTGIIIKSRNFFLCNIFCTLYNTLILSYLQYCSIIWASSYSSHLQPIFRLQNYKLQLTNCLGDSKRINSQYCTTLTAQ